jgi:glycosyltransferase involved in cell wall biosynthesis
MRKRKNMKRDNVGVEKTDEIQISVIIPCLNAAETIKVQLEALSSQQYFNPWEVILADGGSKDETLAVAEKYKDKFYKFRIVDASIRKGPAFARNMGVKAALSERIAFCDADDEVDSGWVEAMVESLKKYDVVYGKFQFDKFNEAHRAEESAQAWKDGLFRGSFLPGGGTGNLGVKRWVHDAIGGFDDRLPWNEDADYFWRLQLEGFTLHYNREAMVQVRLGRVNPSLSYLYRRSMVRAIANYWSYKKYSHLGMKSPPGLMESLGLWLKGFRRIPSLTNNDIKRSAWLQEITRKTGDLVGQIKGRLRNPCRPYQPAKGREEGSANN